MQNGELSWSMPTSDHNTLHPSPRLLLLRPIATTTTTTITTTKMGEIIAWGVIMEQLALLVLSIVPSMVVLIVVAIVAVAVAAAVAVPLLAGAPVSFR